MQFAGLDREAGHLTGVAQYALTIAGAPSRGRRPISTRIGFFYRLRITASLQGKEQNTTTNPGFLQVKE